MAEKGKKTGKKKKSEAGYQVEAADASRELRKAALQEKYEQKIVGALKEKLGVKNPMDVPRLKKIIINACSGDAVQNPKVLDSILAELALIAGQKPILTRARKSLAGFKLREGMPIGAQVTLRKKRMYEFYSRLVNIALPRTRDFQGVSNKSFDGRGNYTLGIREQLLFPEINYDKVDKTRGFNITFVTTAKDNESARVLLGELGMPFRK